MQRWLDEQPTWPTPWLNAAEASDYALLLTPERARQLTAEVGAVIERFRVADDAAAEANRAVVFFRLIPQREAVL